MSELIDPIDRKKLWHDITHGDTFFDAMTLANLHDIVREQPTVDSVVHCKNCVHHKDSAICEGWIDCKTMGRSLKKDSFCSLGEMDEDTERED